MVLASTRRCTERRVLQEAVDIPTSEFQNGYCPFQKKRLAKLALLQNSPHNFLFFIKATTTNNEQSSLVLQYE